MFYIGIDWADQKYDIMILNQSGEAISGLFTISKSQQDFQRLLDRIRKLFVLMTSKLALKHHII